MEYPFFVSTQQKLSQKRFQNKAQLYMVSQQSAKDDNASKCNYFTFKDRGLRNLLRNNVIKADESEKVD